MTTNDKESEGSQSPTSDKEDMDTSLIDVDSDAGLSSVTTPSTSQGSTTRSRRPRYRFDNDGTCRRNELLLQQVMHLSPFMAPHGGALRLWEQIADHCNSVQDLRVANPKDPILTAHNARVHFKDLMTRYGKEGLVVGVHDQEPPDSYQKLLADVYHQWKNVQSMKSEKQMVLGKRSSGQRMEDMGARVRQRPIVSNAVLDRPAPTREGLPLAHSHTPTVMQPMQPMQPHPQPRTNVRIAPEPMPLTHPVAQPTLTRLHPSLPRAIEELPRSRLEGHENASTTELLEAILSHLQQTEDKRAKRNEEAVRKAAETEQMAASREAQRREDADGRERRFQELMVHMQQSTLAVLSRLAELQTQSTQR
ncbi:hypothetical protein BDF14DRAFT_1877223 [Spinellus fusiger]|nr:hypothetical protein BDF14DRAFT_1877223 [Spinellus fusiger]